MAKGTTVFERWRERRRQANLDVEEKFLNPLDARVGDPVSLDLLDWRDYDFVVSQFRVLNRLVGQRQFPLVDYYLQHRGLSEEDKLQVLLRFIPLDDPDQDAGLTHTVLLLQMDDESEFDEDVVSVLKRDAGYTHFVQEEEDGEWVELAFPDRVGGISLPYECEVDIIKDADHDGTVEEEEVESHRLTYWDFRREASRGEESSADEFLFIEIDEEDGWTEFFRGEEISQDCVTKL